MLSNIKALKKKDVKVIEKLDTKEGVCDLEVEDKDFESEEEMQENEISGSQEAESDKEAELDNNEEIME